MKNFAKDTLMPSAVGAVGALGLDLLLGYIPLPAALNTPMTRPLVHIAGAIGMGMIAGKMVSRRVGEQVATGALVVTMYNMLKGFVATAMPNLPLSGGDMFTSYPSLSYAGAAQQVGDAGMYMPDATVGMYVGENS